MIGTIPSEIIRVIRLESPSMRSADTTSRYQLSAANW